MTTNAMAPSLPATAPLPNRASSSRRPRVTAERTKGLPAQYLLEAGGMLRLPNVLSLVGVSRSTWWKLVREGHAPEPVKLTARCTAWRAADIASWLANAGTSEVRP